MSKQLKLSICFVAIAILIGALMFATTLRSDRTETFATPGFGNMTASELSNQSYQVVPEMLSVIYLAFAETDEAVIYDKLAEVSAGDALETLYLERVGAMVGGGLDEADQTLHAMELTSLSSRKTGRSVSMDVKWHVIGTVGHATHLHVRGNSYAATLTVEPVEDIWRITAFDLTNVDRTDAGSMVAAE